MDKIKSIILLNKKEGETPLEALESFRLKHKPYKNIPMTYAGRLDPMASGLLLVLAGEECKQKEKYLSLSKEYEFEVLFGVCTDTYDILGKILELRPEEVTELQLKKNLKFFRGKILQKYPMYSSRTVRGKSLFEYARSGKEVEVPEREVEVKMLKLLSLRKVSTKKLLHDTEKRVKKVEGDFRQKEILSLWKKNLKGKKESFNIAKFKIKCTSGTYVRSIADGLGNKLSIPAIAYKIERTKIGKWGKQV